MTIHDRVTTIGESCFQNCSSLELIRLPASLSEISNNLFRDCPCLKSVSIPENVTRIGENAFLRCGALKKINLPFGVTEIGINAFAECAGLKEIHIPDSVTELGEGALSNCIQLRRVTLPRSLTAISSRLFHNDRLLSRISLPHTVRQIGTEAFAACESLQTLSLPSNLEFIGDVAFLGCSSLKWLTIPDAVTRIPQNLFLNCTSLSEVCLPSGLQEIGQSAFDCCAALTRLNLPPHQITIGSGAFRGCSGLADDNGFVVIQGTLFDCYSPDRRIVIPQGVRRLSRNSLRRIRKPEYLIVPDTVLEAESLVFSEMDSISWAEVSSRSILEDLLEDLSSDTVHRLCHHYLSTDLESDLWRDACYDRRKELMQLYIQGDAAGPAHKLLLCGSVSLSEIQEYLFLSEENLEMTALFLDFQERCFSPEEREAYRIAQSETDLGLRERTLEEWSSILEMDISGGAICINGFKTDTPVLHIPDRIGHLNVLSIHQPRDPWLKCRSCVITLDPEILSVDIGAFSGVPQLTDIYILGADTQLDLRVLGDPPQVTIHAPLNSRAHMFAERFNIPFESIDKEN